MRTIKLFILLFFAIGVTSAKASSMVELETNPTTDTSSEVKNNNNIAIFKIIPAPVTGSNTNNSGSLKKAGKVARTSYSHPTSLENIIYKKKGI
jgi:hypothetical protein